MNKLTFLDRFASDQSGATAIEYAFVASLISIAGVALFASIGTSVSGTFTTVANYL
jgi:pilus assembly protein Flp/PilA